MKSDAKKQKKTAHESRYITILAHPEPYFYKKSALQKGKNGNAFISENVSGNVPSTGAFSNKFLEGMKQLYKLEPFIKVKPYLTNQWEKGNRPVKTAS